MAKKKTNEIAVGITVLVVLGLGFWVVVMLSDLSMVYEPRQVITVRQPYEVGLRGLISGSPVYLGGVKIGQVVKTGIEVEDRAAAKEDGQKIYVYFSLKIPEKYAIREDCVLVPESNVLGGQTVLNIEDVGSEGQVIQDGETVTVTFKEGFAETIMRQFDPENPTSLVSVLKMELDRNEKGSLMASLVSAANSFSEVARKIDEQVTQSEEKETLMTKIHLLLDQLGSAARQLDRQFDREDEEAVLAKLHTALDSLNTSLDHFQDMMQTNKPEVNQLVKSLKNVATTLEEDLPQITGDMKSTLTKLDDSIESAREGLTHFKELTTQARESVAVNRPRIDQMIKNITEVSVNLKLASREIRRAPWKLLYKPDEAEAQVQALLDTARDFSEGAESLYNVTLTLKTVLEEAGEESIIDKQELEKIIEDLEAQFEKYPEIQRKLLEGIEMGD